MLLSPLSLMFSATGTITADVATL